MTCASKLRAALLAALLAGTVSGCGKPVPQTTQPAVQSDLSSTAAETETAPPEEDSAAAAEDTSAEQEPSAAQTDGGGFVWTVEDVCTLTFPASWEGEYELYGDRVFCKSAYDPNTGSGMLLSIEICEEDRLISGEEYYYLLGTAPGGKYVMACITENPPDNAQFDLMFSELDDVLSGAVCSDSPDCQPKKIDHYGPSFYGDIEFAGYWERTPASGVQNEPGLTFNSEESRFQYTCYETMTSEAWGTYLYNYRSAGYEWNTDNWGDFGLLFIDGDAYTITVNYGTPKTINMENVTHPGEDFYGLAASTFGYWSDYEDISPKDYWAD